MHGSSPFGQYAGLVAAVAAIGILLAWVGTAAGVGGLQPSAQLDAAALIILGAVFGTGAGALVVANGVGKSAASANTRLDAMNAPSGPVASALVQASAVDTAASNTPSADASHGAPQ